MENKGRVFFFMPYIPYPVDRGTYQRVYHLFIELSKRYEIDLVCLQEDSARSMEPFEPYTKRRLAVPFVHPPWKRLFPDRFFDPLPTTVSHWQANGVIEKLSDFIKGESYDYVLFIDLVLWPYVKKLFPNHPRKIMDRSRVDWLFQTEELNTLRLGLKERLLRKENLAKIERLERSVYKHLAGMIVCGVDDKSFLQRKLKCADKVFVLPNGFNESFFNSDEFPRSITKQPSILFCGALDYSPNVDAINWFAEAIWPSIYSKRPDAVWKIIGKSPGKNAERWSRINGVLMIGEVPDVRPYYQSSWAQIVPLRIGGGTRLKIVESMGMRCPVVSTSLGAQGLDLVNGKDILLADTQMAFSSSVLDLLDDHDKRLQLENYGHATVLGKYRWDQLGTQLCNYIKLL